MRLRVLTAGLALLLVATASSKNKASDTRTYTTGAFVVNCTSTGQVCKPPKSLAMNPPRSGTIKTVRYTTPPGHCSALVLQVVRNGNLLATSGRIEAGEQTETFHPGIHVPAHSSHIGFRAKGFLGGCNVGRVGSWGGKITVTVKLS
jgi:hypothetical protein